MSLVKKDPCFCNGCFFPQTNPETVAKPKTVSQGSSQPASRIVPIRTLTIDSFDTKLTTLFFSFLGLTELGKCSEVSKRWNTIAIGSKKKFTTVSCFVAERDNPYYYVLHPIRSFISEQLLRSQCLLGLACQRVQF